MEEQLEPEIQHRQQHRDREEPDDGPCIRNETHETTGDADDEVGGESRKARTEHDDRVAELSWQRGPSRAHVALDSLDGIVCILHDSNLRAVTQVPVAVARSGR